MKFQVKRKTWHRGGIRSSALARHDGGMCCLGHLGLALGYTFNEMLGKLMPNQVCTTHEDASKWQGLVKAVEPNDTNSEHCKELARLNDRPGISDTEREAGLTVLFKEAGLEVEFVD